MNQLRQKLGVVYGNPELVDTAEKLGLVKSATWYSYEGNKNWLRGALSGPGRAARHVRASAPGRGVGARRGTR